MVMINTTVSEMNKLLGRNLSKEEYSNLSFRYGLDLDINGDTLNFETTSDRAELISKYGLARLLSQLSQRPITIKDPKANGKESISVEKNERPFVNCLLVKLNRNLGAQIKDLVEIQSKVDLVIGRKRKMAAIGFFDYDKIKFPIVYKNEKNENIKFTPLGYANEKTYDEIINDTDAGVEYSKIAPKKSIIWKLSNGDIMALPPIINADKYSINETTKNIFIDITGTSKKSVNSATKSLIFNLSMISDIEVLKVKYQTRDIDTGLSLSSTTMRLKHEDIERFIGDKMDFAEIIKLLKHADYGVKFEKGIYTVEIPFYRDDMISQVDIIDDILRFYGVSNLKPLPIKTYFTGEKLKESKLSDFIANIMAGAGYQELDANILTNEVVQFDNIGLKREDYAKLSESRSAEISMTRRLIFPEILRFVSNNINKKFPQKLFDVGYVVEFDPTSDTNFSNKLHLSITYSGADANFSDVKAVMKIVLSNIFDIGDLKVSENAKFEQTFIKGRYGDILYNDKIIGVIGEIHPRVLNKFNIPFPTSVAEVFLDRILEA